MADPNAVKKDGGAATVALAIPAEVVLRHGMDEAGQQEHTQERSELRKARAVMFVDKIEQEKFVAEVEPKLEELQRTTTQLSKDLKACGQKIVGEIDLTSEFSALKAELRKKKIFKTVCTAVFTDIDRDKKTIQFSWHISATPTGGYRSSILDGKDKMPFTDEMKDALKMFLASEKEMKQVEKDLIDAKAKLRDRANRQSDVENAIAFKNMDSSDRQEVSDIYAHLRGGLSIDKLIGEGKAEGVKTRDSE